MAVETLYATSLTSGTVTTSGNALGAPDGVFTTDTGNTAWTARFAMSDPTLPQANGTHTVTLRVRKVPGQSGTPTVDSIALYDGATLIATITTGATNVTSATGQDIAPTFAASLLTGHTLSNIEVEVATTNAGGNPSARTPVQLDAITWSGDFAALALQGSASRTDAWQAARAGRAASGWRVRHRRVGRQRTGRGRSPEQRDWCGRVGRGRERRPRQPSVLTRAPRAARPHGQAHPRGPSASSPTGRPRRPRRRRPGSHRQRVRRRRMGRQRERGWC